MIKEFFEDFRKFLDQYNIVSFVLAFVVSNAITSLTLAITNDLIMPVVSFAVPNGTWQSTTAHVGPVVFPIGALGSAATNFFITALIVFFLAKLLLHTYAIKK